MSDAAFAKVPLLAKGTCVDGGMGYVEGLTQQKGYGIFATQQFEIWDTVMIGAPVRRANGNGMHAVQIGVDEFGYEEGIGALVNHSCDPNCGIRLADPESNAFDLIARRPIDFGEEITMDYAMRNFVIEFFPRRCLCGSSICRRRVTGWQDLPEDRRAAYADSVAPFLLVLDAAAEVL